MFHLLKIEWLKVKYYKTFWILSGLFLLSIGGANYIAYSIQEKIYASKDAGNMADMILGGRPYSFPKVWQMTASATSYINFIAGLLMIILVTNEYSFKTHRQNIIDGLKRSEFIITKLLVGCIIAIISTLIVFITALSFGLHQNAADFSFENAQYLLYYFLQTLSYTWIAILFGLVFKRSGIAIGIFFLYTLIIENVVALILNHAMPDGSVFSGLGNFLPIQSTDELIPVPVFEKVQQQLDVPEVNVMLQLCVATAYLVIFFFIGKRKFERDDL